MAGVLGTIGELVAAAKAAPGQMNDGSAGPGSTFHMSAELVKAIADFNILHIAYRGSGPDWVETISGQVNRSFSVLAASVPHVQAPAALVNVTLANGQPLAAGKRVEAFTDSEEHAVQLETVVPFLLACTLTERGAQHQPAPDWTEQVVVDGRLVTGQNPRSAAGVGAAMLELLTTRA